MRFERVFREDMMWFAALMVLLMTGVDIAIGVAAPRPQGELPVVFAVLLVAGFLIGIVAFVIRVSRSRHLPQDTDPALA
ncbi:MAG: hypothetical protein LWW86_05220 [Micrococcales bacterium]|nr:hypothetical protein [Micrococcales bacterium]